MNFIMISLSVCHFYHCIHDSKKTLSYKVFYNEYEKIMPIFSNPNCACEHPIAICSSRTSIWKYLLTKGTLHVNCN
jgi:hypothetical protein